MRQIDNMTPDELETLQLKGMTAPRKPIVSLHPTLRACNCGLVASRRALYRHLAEQARMFAGQTPAERTASWKEYFEKHGEVPLNIDDPRVADASRPAASEAST